MGSLSRRFAAFLLLITALLIPVGSLGAAITGGPIVYWNPVAPSIDGSLPANWTVDAAGTQRFVSSLSSNILSFNGTSSTSNNDCKLLMNTCAGMVSTGSYSGALTLFTATSLSIQGPVDLASARWFAIEAGATLRIDDQQRLGSTVGNRITVPIRMQTNAQARSTVGVLINYSTYPSLIGTLVGDGVGPVSLAVVNINGAGTIDLAGNGTLAAGLQVIDNQLAAIGQNSPVVVSGIVTTPVALGENAVLQVDGQVGDVGVVAGQNTTAAVLRGRGRVAAVTLLPVASFQATAVNVFAGQAQASIGTVSLSSAPTTTVVIAYSDNIGGQATATAGDLPDFNPGTQHLLVFQPGETAKSIVTRIGADASATFNKTFSLTLNGATGAAIGTPQANSVTIVRGTGLLSLVVNGQPISAPQTLAGTFAVGQPLTVVLTGGQPPYTGIGSGLQFLGGALAVSGGGLPQQTFSVAAGLAAPNPAAFSFTDSQAAPLTTVVVRFNTTPPVVAPIPSLTLPISRAPTTIYTPLCPATTQGLANLLSVIGAVTPTDVAAYAWDSVAQAYAKIPAQPGGGLTSTHAVFVASRVALTFDFSGTASPMYSEILLRPGWNFIGVPPINDGGGGAALLLHDLSKFILFPTGTGVSSIDGAERDALMGTAAYFWNGAAYTQVTTMETGKGYWLRNNSTGSLVLVRAPAPATGVARATGGGAQTGLVRYLNTVTGVVASRAIARSSYSGNPPPPPSSSSTAATGNACGSGSGIAAFGLLLLALTGHLLLVRRR